MEVGVRAHRTADAGEADAQLHVATGPPAIDATRARPEARQIAYHDPRSDAQVERYSRLRTGVIEGLTAAGLDDLVPQVDGNLFGLAANPQLPEELVRPIYKMGNLPQPVAVFTWELSP